MNMTDPTRGVIGNGCRGRAPQQLTSSRKNDVRLTGENPDSNERVARPRHAEPSGRVHFRVQGKRGKIQSLAPPYRVLFDRYQFRDIAFKVVGIGSVGTFCEVALFITGGGDPLFLQVKEARSSVLERYAGASAFATHGERLVVLQNLAEPSVRRLLNRVQ